MIYILLAIATFSSFIVIFKFFEKFNINNLQALIVNYAVAGCLGMYFSSTPFTIQTVFESAWVFHAMLIGLLFVTTFNLFAMGTQKVGVAITTITNNLSLIIPVGFALCFYPDENTTLFKIIGIILAVFGIYLSITDGKKITIQKKHISLILLLYVGQGIVNTIFNHAQRTVVDEADKELFFTTLFFMACISGIFLLLAGSVKKPLHIQGKNVLGGIILGIPNYASIIFFFNSLEKSGFESSQVFPIISIGLVISSTLIGLFFFQEKPNRLNWLGLMIAVVAIYLISFY